MAFLPILPNLHGFSVHKRPTFATILQTPPSGREVAAPQYNLPLWEFELTYEVLRGGIQNRSLYSSASLYTEFQRMIETFLISAGQFGWFYFNDSSDNSRLGQPIGTGDGVTVSFPMIRTWNEGFLSLTEPVGGVNTDLPVVVYLNGVLVVSAGHWNISADQRNLVFLSPPGGGVTITSDFSFFYRCRFIDDAFDAEEFFRNYFSVRALKFRSVSSIYTPAPSQQVLTDLGVPLADLGTELVG